MIIKKLFKSIFMFFLLVISINSQGQGLNIQPEAHLKISGAVGISIINGNFTNNGTYMKDTETLILSGNSPRIISGNGSTQVNDLQINNTGGITVKANLLNVNNLSISTNSRLTIDTTRSVTVSNLLTNNAGMGGITIKANPLAANGTLIFNNPENSPVLASVEMYSKANWTWLNSVRTNLKWHFFGVPVRSISAAPTFNGSFIRKYNEAGIGSGLTADKRWIQLQNNEVLTELNGYEIVQESGKTYTIKGELVNKDFTRQLSYTAGAEFPGQHILASPYTAAIDIKKILFGDDVEKSVYQYNTGSYDDWFSNSGGSAAGNSPGQYILSTINTAGDYQIPAQIPSMQGFMVKVTGSSDNATISIPYYTVTTKNIERQRAKAQTIEKTYTVIDVVGSRFSDRMWIYTNPDCTREFDNGWDGRKIINPTSAPQIFAMEPDGNYQINAVDNVNNTEFGFKAGEDTNYTIRFKHVNTASVYSGLYLIDLVNNNILDITDDNSEYTFTTEQTSNPVKRFKIVTNPGVTTEIETQTNSSLSIFNSDRVLFIDNKTSAPGKLYIYDLAGQLVQQTTFGSNTITSVNASLTTGTYIARGITSGIEQVRKILIN